MTQVDTLQLKPSEAGYYSTYLPRREERLELEVGYQVCLGLPVRRRPPIPVVTSW